MDELKQDVFQLLNWASRDRANSDRAWVERKVTDDMVDKWAESKAWLLPALGPDFRVELPIEAAAFRNEGVFSCITESSVRIAVENANKNKFSSYMESFIQCAISYTFNRVCAGAVADNLLESGVVFKLYGPYPHNTQRFDFILPSGLKLSKALAAEFDRNLKLMGIEPETKARALDVLNIALSQLIQSVTVSTDAKLVISANPLDILMASVHTSGWNSCHSIRDGAHRAAQLAYLLDSKTFVAYVYQKKAHFSGLDRQTPVKIWRMTLHADPESKLIIFGRPFPNANIHFLNAVKKALPELLKGIMELESAEGTFFKPSYAPVIGHWAYADVPSDGFKYAGVQRNTSNIKVADQPVPCLCCGKVRENYTHATILWTYECYNAIRNGERKYA